MLVYTCITCKQMEMVRWIESKTYEPQFNFEVLQVLVRGELLQHFQTNILFLQAHFIVRGEHILETMMENLHGLEIRRVLCDLMNILEHAKRSDVLVTCFITQFHTFRPTWWELGFKPYLCRL
jgi:hypothetical protein